MFNSVTPQKRHTLTSFCKWSWRCWSIFLNKIDYSLNWSVLFYHGRNFTCSRLCTYWYCCQKHSRWNNSFHVENPYDKVHTIFTIASIYFAVIAHEVFSWTYSNNWWNKYGVWWYANSNKPAIKGNSRLWRTIWGTQYYCCWWPVSIATCTGVSSLQKHNIMANV